MKLSPTMEAMLRLFDPQCFSHIKCVRLGHWVDVRTLLTRAPRHVGYTTLKSLETRGLVEHKWLICVDDATPLENCGRFYRLTHLGVSERARLEGWNWS